MKLKYLFTAVISAFLLAGCSEDNEPAGTLGSISLSTTYATIADEGGSSTVTIEASEAWQITNIAVDETTGEQVLAENCEPIRDKNGKTTATWFKTSQLSGDAGETVLSFEADATESGREFEVQIKVGNSFQYLRVRQGSYEAQSATCEQVINGVDGKTYRVKGMCTAIANTTYGNWYMNDGTGEVYIYGTLDADGGRQNFASLGIEVGDVVEVEGPRLLYGSTTELVDVTVISITKSLLKIASDEVTLPKEGGELEVKVAFKGNGAYVDIPEEYQSWISYKSMDYVAGVPTKIETNPADTAVFKFNVLSNAGGAREATLMFKSSKGSNTTELSYTLVQEGGIEQVTIADFNSREDGSALYNISGIITKIVNDTYGNMYIKDASGEAYIYGTLTADGQSKQFSTLGLKVGDVVTLVGPKTSYNGSPQMKDGIYQEHIDVTPISVADFRNVEDSNSKYYMLTGRVETVTEEGAKDDIETYGNFNITDETGSVYVYGVTTGWNGERKMFGTLGVKYGDTITILATKSTYKGLVEAVGIYVSHTPAE